MSRLNVGRRTVLGAAAAGFAFAAAGGAAGTGTLPAVPLGTVGKPPPSIAAAEYLQRIIKAQRLMKEADLAALLVEPGSSLTYFTGIQWRRSERLTCAVIPAAGEVTIVTPFFEEPSVRESLAIPAAVRTWLEHEDPTALVGAILSAQGAASGQIGTEETNRYFILDGLQRNLPSVRVRNAAAVVRGCRTIKSPAEIALMQHATDITIAAYRYTVPRVRLGMHPTDISVIMHDATEKLGGRSLFQDVLVGEAAAYPHGSDKPQQVVAGAIVLMDCGCAVEGYQSDVSRTFVVGTPTSRQRQVWDQVAHGQRVVFAAARIGQPAGSVDDAVRSYYERLGYGPDYTLPGLSHRTGHGIGLDGHEPINLVRGEREVLRPGMCFSNEPGLYLPGAFGVRLEDCFYMTEQGPRWFSRPPFSIDRPV